MVVKRIDPVTGEEKMVEVIKELQLKFSHGIRIAMVSLADDTYGVTIINVPNNVEYTFFMYRDTAQLLFVTMNALFTTEGIEQDDIMNKFDQMLVGGYKSFDEELKNRYVEPNVM